MVHALRFQSAPNKEAGGIKKRRFYEEAAAERCTSGLSVFTEGAGKTARSKWHGELMYRPSARPTSLLSRGRASSRGSSEPARRASWLASSWPMGFGRASKRCAAMTKRLSDSPLRVGTCRWQNKAGGAGGLSLMWPLSRARATSKPAARQSTKRNRHAANVRQKRCLGGLKYVY